VISLLDSIFPGEIIKELLTAIAECQTVLCTRVFSALWKLASAPDCFSKMRTEEEIFAIYAERFS
jgi:hypothetical protein